MPICNRCIHTTLPIECKPGEFFFIPFGPNGMLIHFAYRILNNEQQQQLQKWMRKTMANWEKKIYNIQYKRLASESQDCNNANADEPTAVQKGERVRWMEMSNGTVW